MSEGVIIAIVGLLAVPLGYVVGWFVNRRTNISTLYKNITEAAETSVETMQHAMERLSNELQDAGEKIEKLKDEIEQLRHQNLLLLQENHSLHRKIDDLVRYVNSTTGEIPQVDPSSSPES